MAKDIEYITERDWDLILAALRQRREAFEANSRACYLSGTASGTRRRPRPADGLVADYDVLGRLFSEQAGETAALAERINSARESGAPIDTLADRSGD